MEDEPPAKRRLSSAVVKVSERLSLFQKVVMHSR